MKQKQLQMKILRQQSAKYRVKVNKPPKPVLQVKFNEFEEQDNGCTEGVILRQATWNYEVKYDCPSFEFPKLRDCVRIKRPQSMRDRFILNDMQGMPLSVESFIHAADALKQDL